MNAELNDRPILAAVPPPDGLPKPRRYLAIAAVSFGAMVTAVDGTIANVALPTLARELHVPDSAAVLVITVYQLVLMMTLLPFSALGQRYGHRVTFICGLCVYMAATTLCFFAHSLPFLVLVRGVQALGAAAATSVSVALIRNIYPISILGRGLSFNTMVAAGAASIAPTLGGALLSFAHWPWLFAAVAPCGVLAILFGRRSLPDAARHDEPYDVLGAILCASTFGLMIFGLESAVHGDSPVISVALVAASVWLGIFYVGRARHQSAPVFPVDLLRTKRIALPCVGSFAAYLAITLLMVALPFRLQQQFHFTPAAAGAALAPIPMVMLVVAPTSGSLSDRIPAGLLGGIGMAIGFVALLCLALLPEPPTQFDVLWRVALCGLGFGMFFSPNARQVVAAAPRARAAAAGALFSTLRGAGQTLGATTIAALLALGYGIGPVPALIAASLALIAAICSATVLQLE